MFPEVCNIMEALLNNQINQSFKTIIMKKYGKIKIEEAFDTKNPEIVNVRLTQEYTDPAENPIGACLGKLQSRKISHIQGFSKSLLAAAGVTFEAKEENGKTRKMAVGSPTLQNLFGEGADDMRLIRLESTTPFYEGQEAKINPQTQAVVTHGGQPIYRYAKLGSASDSDVLLSNDRVEVAVSQGSELAH